MNQEIEAAQAARDKDASKTAGTITESNIPYLATATWLLLLLIITAAAAAAHHVIIERLTSLATRV